MRHAILALIAAMALLLGWRVSSIGAAGRRLHDKEVAGRAMAEQILRAEIARQKSPPPGARIAPYEYLSTLVAERRVDGLEPVTVADRDCWRAGAYLFHVRLLNKLRRPLALPPADPGQEPELGQRFELWAWPADPEDVALALFFGSQSGYLLQGENGNAAGHDARPEDAGTPMQKLSAETGANDDWITLLNVRE